MPFAALGSDNVHYQLAGPAGAPALLLIHSLGASTHVFDAISPRLARRLRVLRYDLPGHGLSSPPEGGRSRTVGELARGALALCDALGIARAHVLGLSLGGQVALELAASTPDRVDRLVLCATALRIGAEPLWSQRIEAVERGGLEPIADGVIARWTTPEFAAREPAELAGLRAQLLATSRAGYVAACAALRAAELRGACARVKAPVLVLAGERDPAVPVEDARALASALPGARFERIAEAAHLPVVEQPEAVAAFALDFLCRAPASAETLGELYERGLAVRRSVLGAAHVERALAGAGALDRDFQEWITRSAWGGVWARPGLDRRTRSLATIALLVALGRDEELALHLRASRNTGVAPDELAELLLHCSVYAGVPAANAAFRIARAVLSE
jgi:3-oxoadipate enol-lactonase/4-carboxymuconolactone decarboxylase